MKLETKTKWLELYEIANKIEDVAPWNDLWDTYLFVYVEDNNLDNALYFCTMGKVGVHKSIAIYKGNQIIGYHEIIENKINSLMGINYQECLKVCYLSEEDTIIQNKVLIKDLDLKFSDSWISFEKFERGYEMGPIDEEEIVFMTKALEIYYDMYREYKEKSLKIDFDKGLSLFRKKDTQKNEIVDDIEMLKFPIVQYNTVLIEDSYKEKLKKAKKTNMELEIEFLNYIPLHIESLKDDNGRHIFPFIYILVEKNSQFILDMNLEEKQSEEDYDKYIIKCINRLVQTILEIGIPKKIYARDFKTKCVLKDLAEKAKIDIIIKGSLPAIDFVVEKLYTGEAFK